MSRVRAIVLASCACAAPAVALAAKPAPTTVTIGIAPATITFGKAATVSGTTAANASVTLRADAFPFNGTFSQVAKTTSNASGAYAFNVSPDRTTHYRVDVKAHPAARSAVAALAVRWHVTRTVSTRHPKRGTRVLFSGTVGPAHTGGTAEVQRLTAGAFKTVKTAVLAAATPTSSTYSVRVRVRRSGTYRVKVAADADHLAGHSRRVSLVVH
jgi:hypothetical protein